jgi:tRNA A-37 threonylcarbamoyl transferase component Bud32
VGDVVNSGFYDGFASKYNDVFDYLESIEEAWVEDLNEGRGGSSGVIKSIFQGQTVYIKKQTNHLYHSFRYPMGRPTALREKDCLERVRKIGIPVPEILYCESRKSGNAIKTYLVTREMTGFMPLDHFCQQRYNTFSEAEKNNLISKLAENLALLHHHKLQHSALYPKHIFIKFDEGEFDVGLIDLETMRSRFSAERASRRDLNQFRRHQPDWGEASWACLVREYQQAKKRISTR